MQKWKICVQGESSNAILLESRNMKLWAEQQSNRHKDKCAKYSAAGIVPHWFPWTVLLNWFSMYWWKAEILRVAQDRKLSFGLVKSIYAKYAENSSCSCCFKVPLLFAPLCVCTLQCICFGSLRSLQQWPQTLFPHYFISQTPRLKSIGSHLGSLVQELHVLFQFVACNRWPCWPAGLASCKPASDLELLIGGSICQWHLYCRWWWCYSHYPIPNTPSRLVPLTTLTVLPPDLFLFTPPIKDAHTSAIKILRKALSYWYDGTVPCQFVSCILECYMDMKITK